MIMLKLSKVEGESPFVELQINSDIKCRYTFDFMTQLSFISEISLDVGHMLDVLKEGNSCLQEGDVFILEQSSMSFFMPLDFTMNKVDQTETNTFE